MNQLVPTFPKSVQPGLPKLGHTPDGWTRYRLGDVFDVVSRPVDLKDNKEYDLVTVRRARGGIAFRERLPGRKIAVKSQFYIREGDFLISKRQIVHGACGIVSAEFDDSIVSNEYTVLRPRKMLLLEYLGYLVHSIYMQQTFFHASIGVHVEKMIFRLEDWFSWLIHLPPIETQQEIVDAVSSSDEKVGVLRAQMTSLENFKLGLARRLFSQELRFTRRDGSAFPEWQERSLGDIATFRKGSGIAKSEISKTGKVPCIHYGDLFRNHGTAIKRIDTFTDIDEGVSGSTGDVLMPASDVTPTGLCTASALMESGVKLGGDIIIIRPKEEIDCAFRDHPITGSDNIRSVIPI